MATTLKAYAIKDGNDINVTLLIIKDLNEISEKSFNLPKEKGAFTALTNELYDFDEKPTYVTKKEFKEQFVDWTLNQNYEIVDAQAITDHCENLFQLSPEESIGYVEGMSGPQDISTITARQKEELDKLLASTVEENQKTLDQYMKKFPLNESGDSDDPTTEYPWTDQRPDPQHHTEEFLAAEMPPPAGGAPIDEDTTNIAAQANYNADTAGSSPPPLPKTKNKRPVVDQSNLNQQSLSLLTQVPASVSNNLKGIAGDRLIEPVPAPIKYPGDGFIEGENNALVQCGRDEIYRLKGHTQSGAVYLAAGRSPNNIETEDKTLDAAMAATSAAMTSLPGGFGVGAVAAASAVKEVIKSNNLVRDSAYLYLSQKSDSESLLRVAGGTYAKKIEGPNPRAGLSLAAIKADDVVIVSRQSGIRLITGTDKTNSSGGELVSKFGIELIAGNDDSDLQPLIKGNNLELYLTTFSEVISNLRSVVYNMLTSQLELNAELALHEHYDPFSIYLGTSATGNPFALNGGKSYLSPTVLAAGTKAIFANAVGQANIITGVMLKRINNDFNAFNPIGAYNIKSQKNKTN